ncbi:MAG: 3-oxoacyl-[acyl-carrier-protein] reductase [Fimbriimonadaceae bacterium]|nr:3-oxoacyl-[acyl-carrier-protein] reductase [Fimbriimonadaceae bacterium]
MDFTDQIVVVTGASRGIGRAIAQRFAEAGAVVACVATTEQSAGQTALLLDQAGFRAIPYACDVGHAEQVEAMMANIQDQLGTPHVLVNNAGIARDALLVRMKDEDWDRVLEVNLKGAYLCIKAVTRAMMKARYGRIVNVSSVVGLHGASGQANYAAAKAGLIGLTKAVAKELGSRGVTCNAIAPGFIETDMTHDLPEDFRKYVETTAPAGRLGTANDVAPAVLFLASREAGYITGQTLTIDGGLFL